MSTTPVYDPMTSDARSSWLAGLTEACNKISGTLNMKTSTFENLTLPELYISEDDRFRIYQAPLGNKLWIANPAPVIKKNGVVITPANDHFSIDYLGGSIAFEDEYVLTASDVVTASATYIVDGSGQIDTLIEQIEAISTEAGRNKGAYDSLTSLQAAYPTATAGDFAIVTDEDTIYIWDVETTSWVNIHKDVDLSAYYTSAQTDNLLSGKEDSISAHGTTAASDNYYYGGRKTWVDLLSKIRSFALTGLVTSDDSVVTAADTLLVAVGKLQAQISSFDPYIKGTSAPTTSTVGKVGQDYVNTSNGNKYHLVSIEDGNYNWEQYPPSNVVTIPKSGNITLPDAFGAGPYTIKIVEDEGGEANNVKMVPAVILKGRMLGDVDGDGKITQADADMIFDFIVSSISLDAVAKWCADVDLNDRVNSSDASKITNFILGRTTIDFADYYGNWTYVSEEGQDPYWTADIFIPGLTVQSSATVVVSGEWGVGMFSSGEIIENGIRIRSIAPPITDAPCTVFYGAGDGSVVVCGRLLPTPDDIGAARAPKIIGTFIAPTDWDENNQYTKEIDGISKTENNQIIQVIPRFSSMEEYINCKVTFKCDTEEDGFLIFHAETIPTKNVGFRVLITDLT